MYFEAFLDSGIIFYNLEEPGNIREFHCCKWVDTMEPKELEESNTKK